MLRADSHSLCLQESLCRGLVTAEKLRAVPAGQLLDVPALLGGAKGAEPPALLPEPVHVIGFSDEEGIRWVLSVHMNATARGTQQSAGQTEDLDTSTMPHPHATAGSSRPSWALALLPGTLSPCWP